MGEAPQPLTMSAAIGALLWLAAISQSTAATAACPPAESVPVSVSAVIDGDTVRLADNRIVRLAGILAPKLPLAEAAGTPWPPAAAATSALTALTAGGGARLAPVGATDRYGRLHASLTLPDGTNAALAMARAGMTRVAWLADETACLAPLLAAESEARQAKRGLWADPAYAVRTAEDSSLSAQTGLYELVEGRVASVGQGTRVTFLNFGKDTWRDFTVMVPAAVVKVMVDAGTPPDGLVGRKIRVRGVIEVAGGPVIRLHDPVEIELLDTGDGENDGSASR